MADIALRKYIEQVDSLIEQKQLDEAIAHCKNILAFYPKSLEAYRTLGKALLEKGRHGDAGDIFQRILSAVPDDFVSHVGMSIVREDEANLDAALWHMERAFESNPANTAIQEELRRLYGRRDGVVPPRARLTRGALARMYHKGALYPQAEAELRAALQEEADRLDLQTVLAQVLFEAERRPEAADVCARILEKLPYSMEANRILAHILVGQNRHDEAKVYRQRLEALDPYEAFADGAGSQGVNPDTVRVPELAIAPELGEGPMTSTPEWAESLGERIDSPFGEPAAETSFGDLFGEPETSEPAWVRKGTGSLTAEPSPLTGGDLPAAGEVPDWMKDIEPVTAPETPTELPEWMKTGSLGGESPTRKTGSRLTDRLNKPQPAEQDTTATEALSPAEMPDWMRDIAPAEAEAEVTPAADMPDWMKTGMLGEAQPSSAVPDWMKTSDESATTALPWAPTSALEGAEATPAEELPEWLKASGAEPTAPKIETNVLMGGETPDLSELPAWMKPSTEGQTTALEAEETAAPSDSLPDWMKAGAASAGAAAFGAAADEVPEWMKTQPEEAAPAEPTEALPDWLKGPAEPVASDELPAWMKPPTPEAAPKATAPIELPDFLQPASEEAIERANQTVEWEEPAAPAEPVATVDDSGVPDWIKAMAPDPNAPALQIEEGSLPPVAADELPDWLQPGAATQPATPAFEAPAPAEDLPDWLKPAPSEAEGSAAPSAPVFAEAEAAPSEDLPDWLKAAAPQDEAFAAPPTVAAAPAEEEAVPDLSSMSADDAMRWLEGLAAKQGAAPEELITQPEERIETPPAWLAAQVEEPAAPVAPTPAEELPLPPADLPPWAQTTEPGASDTVALWLSDKKVPDWMRKPGEPVSGPSADWLRAPIEPQAEPEEPEGAPALPDWLSPAPSAAEPPQIAEPSAPAAEPDFSSMSADDAMRWLEGLAAKQGAAPEELITQPEERIETPPAWLAAQPEEPVSFSAPAEEPIAAPAMAEELPDWLKGAPESTAEPASFAAPTSAPAEEAAPDLSSMDADEAMRWLEGLAAKQGAAPEELITKPEERTAQPPGWITERHGPVMPPTGILPDIFQAETPEPAPPAPSGEEEVPDLSSMSADDAMRWLEGLAAKQGAAPEELITQPEERIETPPAWLTTEAESAQPEEPARATAPLRPEERATSVPAWLSAYQEEAEPAATPDWLKPAPSQVEPSAPAAPPTEEAAPDLASMDADDAMRWLEGLAAKQGAAPEELITQPEERVETPPAWLATEPEAPPQAEPAPEPVSGLPDWIRAAEPEAPTIEPAEAEELPDWIRAAAPPEETPPAAAAPAPPTAPEPERRGNERLARLAERLAASKRAKEDEVAARLEKQRSDREAAMREVQQKMEERRRPTPGTGPLRPGTGPLRPGTGMLKQPAPTTEPEAAAPEPAPEPTPTAPLAEERPRPAPSTARLVTPTRIGRKKGRGKSPFAGQAPDDVFAASRQHLIEGGYEQAAEGFGYLVRKNHMVNEVVMELELFTSSHPGEPVMFSVLGDAYMKSNQMQKALDAYRLALTQM